jgi:dephospho-CoA kinase
MLRVGLTGGIGSGKTTIAKIFASLGVPVFDSDKAAKELMQKDAAIKKNIIKIFGAESYKNNELNRAYISSIAFSNPEKLQQLNSVVHPATIQQAKVWFAAQKGAYAIKEAALIFESGSDPYLDYVIGVTAPENIRIKRTVERDNTTEEKVKERMKRQMDEAKKMSLCNFVINNSGKESVLSQVLSIHIQLKGLAAGKLQKGN